MPIPTIVQAGRAATPLSDAASSVYYVTATAGSPAHVDGSWQELEDSVPFDTDLVELRLVGHDNGNQGFIWFLVDVAIGAGGSEVTILSDLLVGCGDNSQSTPVATALLPLRLPAGTRLAFRCRCSSASEPVSMTVTFFKGGALYAWEPVHRAVTIGADASNSRGTTLTPSGTLYEKGSWAQLVASTSTDARYLLLLFGATVNSGGYHWLVDIGIGSGGSETIILPDLWTTNPHFDDTVHPWAVLVPHSIPAGTRIAARCNCNVTFGPPTLDVVGVLLC